MKYLFILLISVTSFAHTKPDPALTPGVLCTANDPDFKEFRYKDHTPICKRHVTREQRKFVAMLYGIPWEQVKLYEFDHYIPLSLGGSNSSQNLWYQIWEEAHKKDRLIQQLYYQLRDEVIDQKQAWTTILNWFEEESWESYED